MPTSRVAVLQTVQRLPALDVRPQGLPLRQLAQQFLTYKQFGESTRRNHIATLKHLDGLPDHPGPLDFVQWYARLSTPDEDGVPLYSPRTVALDRWNVCAWYEWGAATALSYGNPARLAPFKVPEPRPRAIGAIAKEWPRIRAAAWDARSLAFLTVCRYEALRCGEALALCPEDFAGGMVSINKQRKPDLWKTPAPKHGKCRRLPVHAEVAAAVERIEHRPSVVSAGRGGCNGLVTVPFLFPYRGADLRRLRERLAAAHPAFAEENEFLHVFRHSRAAELRERDNDVLYIQGFLGHSNPRTTQRYLASLVGQDAPAPRGDVLALDGIPLEWAPDVAAPKEAAVSGKRKGGARRKV